MCGAHFFEHLLLDQQKDEYLFPKEILSFIYSSIELLPFMIDPTYLNDLTCSR